MAKSPPPPGDEEKKIADADWLVSETPKAKPRSKPRSVTPSTSRPEPKVEADRSYDLVESDDEPSAGTAPPSSGFPDPLAPVAPVPAPRKPKPKADAAESAPAGPPATVDQ